MLGSWFVQNSHKKGNFLIGVPGEKRTKWKINKRLAQVFSIRIAESFRVLTHLLSPHKMPFAAKPPQALQLEPRREYRLIWTILPRAIEGIKINSICPSMWDMNQNPQDQPSTRPNDTVGYYPGAKFIDRLIFICIPQRSVHVRLIAPASFLPSFDVRL